MSEYRVAGRYAKSLIDLARERNILEAVFADMQTLKHTLENSHELDNLLKSPIINSDKKMSVLRLLFENKFNALTLSFFDIIVRKKREAYMAQIIRAFIEMYNDLNKITVATVKTAVEATEATKAQIKDFLQKQTGKTVELKTTVDKELIGGVVIQIEDKLFDASIAGKLQQAKKELLNTYISK